jgi:hypothetical protein
MATGAGKTTVMAMIITWQVLNALTYPKRNKDFSRAVFIVAPGLTVKERLQVLLPSEGSYYDEFNLCPSEALRQKLNQAEVLIENWHRLMPLKEADRSVVKKGRESDEAFTRRVLGKLAAHKDIIVINDEAHHAYRKPPEVKISKKAAAEQGIDLDEATRWIEGLDRIHKTRRIQRCFDLSATPFAPTGKKSTDTALFDWIISDFGLNDAIEAGLVKTPRVVVRDDAVPDAKTLRSKLYHIYRDPSVSEDLNRAKAEPHEALPKLVQDAYTLLGADWRETRARWQEAGHHSPPVMLTVCNRTETAARIENYFNKGDAHWPELHAPNRTLRSTRRCSRRPRSANRIIRQGLRGAPEGDHRRGRPARNPPPAVPRPEEGGTAARDRGQRREAGHRRSGPSERHIGGDAVGGMGRQERHPHHGAPGLHVAAALRAGRRARIAPSVLRHRRERPVPARIRQRLRRAALDLGDRRRR